MSSVDESSPALRYYRANEGRWEGDFVFVVTDRDALARSRLAPLDRLRVFLMSLVVRVLGPLRMRTSVDATTHLGRREVVHRTRISKWGMPLYVSTESFRIEEDGCGLSITRRERMWPSLVHSHEEGASRGAVAEDAKRASYDFPFVGVAMHQSGAIEEGGVRIVQETAFSRAESLLRRR